MFQDEKGRRVIRLGDTTSHGGKVITGAEMWNVFGKPVARVGDKVICPKCDNKVYEIVEGSPTMSAFNRPIAFDGHRTSCGATLISSLESVRYSSQVDTQSNERSISGAVDGNSGGESNISEHDLVPFPSTTNEVKPSRLLELDKRAILMRYREAINYMNKYGLRFKGFAPDTMLGYGLADGIWNDFRGNDIPPGSLTGGKYYRCHPQTVLVIDWLYDLFLNYKWTFNIAAGISMITRTESHYWVEAIAPIGSTIIHMDPLYDKITYPSTPHPFDKISRTNDSYLFINSYRDQNDTRFEWEYREDRFQSGQKLRERRVG